MSDLEDKLNSILGNPQAMSQIMSLAQSLGGGSSSSSGQTSSDAPPAPDAPPSSDVPPAAAPNQAPAASSGTAPNTPPLDLGALLGGLTGDGGGLDPRLLTLASRVMSEYQSNDDGRTALLQALRPFVKEKRYAKLDKAIQIARLSRMIRVALDVMKGGGSEHV